MLSYKDKIEACILAFAANLVPEIVLLSILIGRPSRVLIKGLQNQIHQNRCSIIISYSRNDLFWLQNVGLFTARTSVAAAVLNPTYFRKSRLEVEDDIASVLPKKSSVGIASTNRYF
jgi:hypothetical protein